MSSRGRYRGNLGTPGAPEACCERIISGEVVIEFIKNRSSHPYVSVVKCVDNRSERAHLRFL